MPVKIEFQVISCSGEDDKYRVSELNYHGPTVRGWRSSPKCKYPQEIILKLRFPAILHQIQILVHQYLIPQKVEIYTCSRLDFERPSESFQDLFEYLGFITFSDNKATGFRSRELKSILIPSRKAKYVKLRIYNNHLNNKNVLNQVGLIGINIFGDEINFKMQETELNSNLCHCSNTACTGTTTCNFNYIPPYDDLAFEMYVDEETAKIIKFIENKKQQAIFEDHFEHANNLKIMLKKLRAAGEIIGLYEQEKKQAIQSEDYDKAKFKKLQIEKFRKKVYSALHIDQVIDSFHTEEITQKFPKPDDQNNYRIIKSDSGDFAEFANSYFQNKFSDNARSPRRSVLHRDTSYGHIIHSKSQTSFPTDRDVKSPAFIRNNAFAPSISNPQLNHYLQSNCDRENKSTVENKLEYIRTTSPSTSNPSDPEQLPEQGSSRSLEPFDEKRNGEKSELHHWNGVIADASKSMPERLAERRKSKAREQSNGRSKSVGPNASKSSFEAYEDRMLPALKSYHGNEVVRECQLIIDQQTKTTLNERERKQAILPISVFGIEMIEKFFSKNFSDKEEGLKQLQRELKKMVDSSREDNGSTMQVSYNKVARAAIFLLHRTLRDKVYSVYSGSAETIRLFFTEFVPQRVSASEVARSVEKLLPELLAKSGDVTPRIHNMAAHTLLSMAECEEVRQLHIISSHLSRPLMSSVHPRLALSRLEMVEQLILNDGISSDKRSGLTCRTLAEFGSSGLHHPAESVRKVSERILIHVYKVNPKMVRKQLPPDDAVTRRNLLYRHLFQEFDLMDVQRKFPEQRESKRTISNGKSNPECSPKKIVFPRDFVQEGSNFSGQAKTVENSSCVDSREKNEIGISPQKRPSKSPSRFMENNSEITTQKASKVDFRLEKVSNSKKKNVNLTCNERKDRKIENDTKSSLNSSIGKIKTQNDVSTVKFPFLADFIDTNKARLLLEEKKILEHNKKIEYIFAEGETEKNNKTKSNPTPAAKKTIKKDVNVSSGLPLPTSGSTRKFRRNILKMSNENQRTNHAKLLANENSVDDNRNSKFVDKRVRNKLEQRKEKLNSEMDDSRGEVLGCTEKNAESFKYISKKNVDKMNFKNRKEMEKSNPFSESMLASIRENEYPSNSMLNGMYEEKGALKTCIFCSSTEFWPDDESLNNHYLKDCPMLTTCEYCMEVIEISGFTNHLLVECHQSHLFQKCCKCQQAVLEDMMDNHECAASSKLYKTRCPFCHKDMGSGENCWRNHFMGNDLCKNHPRQTQ